MRDKDTKQSKGLAYVTFADPMDAAIAFEQCDQGIGISISFIDILYHNVIIPNVYRSKTITWNTCCKKNKIN